MNKIKINESSLSNRTLKFTNKSFFNLAFAILFLGLFFGFSAKASAAAANCSTSGGGTGYCYVDSSCSAFNGDGTCNGIPPTCACATSSNGPGPFRSIAGQQLKTYAPGDHIMFRAGKSYYNGTLSSAAAGTADNPIVFDSYGVGAKPLITGSNIKTTWTADIYSNVWSTALTSPPSNSWVWFDNILGVKRASKSELTTQGDWYWETAVLYVYAISNPASTYTNPGITVPTNQYAININNDHLTFRNLAIGYTTASAVITTSAPSNTILENMDSYYAGGNGFSLILSGTTVLSNITANYSYVNGFYLGGASVYNANNAWSDYHITGPGFSTYDSAILNCAYCKATNGQSLDAHGFAAHGTSVLNLNYSLAYHNDLNAYSNVPGTSGTILNSVFIDNNTGSTATRGGVMFQAPGPWTMKNTVVADNKLMDIYATGANLVLHLDNNIYYNSNRTPNFILGATNYASLSAWGTASGQDAHSLNTNPLFVSSSDFNLQSTSPAINAGTDVGLTSDFAGNPKSGANWDIGAYEFQDSTAPTTTANIDTGLYNSTQSVTLTCNDGAGVGCDKIYYTTDGSDPVTNPNSTRTQATSPAAVSINSTTTLKFYSIDKNNNVEASVNTKTYTIDTTFPNTTITSNPTLITNSTDATFQFDATETSTFQCKLDSGSFSSCTSPKNYTNLTEGSHTFQVKATDTATNEDQTPASYTWTVDTIVLALSDSSPTGTLNSGTTSTEVSINTNKNATCKYSTTSGIDFDVMTSFTTTGNQTHSFTAQNLVDSGNYGFFVKCQDQLTNISDETLISFSVASPLIIIPTPTTSNNNHSSHKDKPTPPRKITNSKKVVKNGATLIRRGSKFSKNTIIKIYFSKPGGGYFTPLNVKTSKTGSFVFTNRVSKPVGTHSWYVFDPKSGKKSRTIFYKVK